MHLHHYNGSIFLERNGKSVFAGGKTAENASEEYASSGQALLEKSQLARIFK